MKNCFVAQSGGPTVAINASLAGVIAGVAESGIYDTLYGSVNGIKGIIDDNLMNLSNTIAGNPELMKRLIHTPAMYLGSCRFKLPSWKEDVSVYETIFNRFKEYNIGAFFYIGGNDSMDTVLKLSDYARNIGSDIRIIGVPKTIDNDLMVTDHTPGFGSAAKYVATSVLEVAHDTYIYAVKTVTIIEIMGRDAGWLTAAAALARNSYSNAPQLIYLPETDFNREEFVEDVRCLLKTNDSVVVAVSEGIHDADGKYISAGESSADTFGHSQLSGAGKALEYIIKDTLGVKVRSIEINTLQRCGAHISSKTDLDEAYTSGKSAVGYAEEYLSGIMVVMNRVSDSPYTIEYSYARIADIANEAKSVPREWINARGNDIMPELLDYLRPLIQGETPVEYENGLPVYMDVSHLTRKHDIEL